MGILSEDVIILMTDEAHFRIFVIGQRKLHNSSIKGLFTVYA
jgi:hypothetical protein